MTKTDLGSKRTCPECGARFFDMKKKNPECVKCGTVCEDPKPAKPRRGARPAVAPAPLPPPPGDAAEAQDPVLAAVAADPKKAAEEEIIDNLVPDEENKDLEDTVAEDEDELIEDTSELGKDTDDVSEVMEHVDEGVTDKV